PNRSSRIATDKKRVIAAPRSISRVYSHAQAFRCGRRMNGMTGRRLLHFEVLEKLGEGGMGAVYRALDTRLNRHVAIKVLPSDKLSDPDRKRRFIQEAQTASALNHPNIITIHDIAADGEVQFIVMELVSGRTLA